MLVVRENSNEKPIANGKIEKDTPSSFLFWFKRRLLTHFLAVCSTKKSKGKIKVNEKAIFIVP